MLDVRGGFVHNPTMTEREREPMTPGDEAPSSEPAAGEQTCPACEGSGRTGDGPCGQCGGTGSVTEVVGGG